MKKIVCFGGGNAMTKAVLPGLIKYPVKITTITSMIDSGGSTGQLRRDFGILPPGDIRRHLIALSGAEQWKKDLFAFKFGHEEFDEGHKGHSLGNAFLGGLEYLLGDYEKVLEIVHQFLEIKDHEALPATIDKVNLYAELENGEIIYGEDEIDVPRRHNGCLSVKKVYLLPPAEAYLRSLEAISRADLISIGPGDLYSSLIPCFLSRGIPEAMKKTKAKKVFVCPPLTKHGETDGFSVKDFSDMIESYIGCPIDLVLYNSGTRNHNGRENNPVRIDLNLGRNKFYGIDLLDEENNCEECYNPDKVALFLYNILYNTCNKNGET